MTDLAAAKRIVSQWNFTPLAAQAWFLYDHTSRRPIMHCKAEERFPFRSWSKQARYRAANKRLWGDLYFSPVRR